MEWSVLGEFLVWTRCNIKGVFNFVNEGRKEYGLIRFIPVFLIVLIVFGPVWYILFTVWFFALCSLLSVLVATTVFAVVVGYHEEWSRVK